MRRFLLACALFALPVAAQAQRTLTIAAQSAPTAMDPHFHRSNSNNAVLRHVFDPLVDFDTAGRLVPRLAEAWRAVDDLTWEFRLRENLRFHDGTPLEPEDIAFSFARLPLMPNSPGSFASAVRTVASVTAVDPRTVRITTREPTPFLGTVQRLRVCGRGRYDRPGRCRLGNLGWAWCCGWSRRGLMAGRAASMCWNSADPAPYATSPTWA
jgi:peptide/nickel transport system substrate-binding protein